MQLATQFPLQIPSQLRWEVEPQLVMNEGQLALQLQWQSGKGKPAAPQERNVEHKRRQLQSGQKKEQKDRTKKEMLLAPSPIQCGPRQWALEDQTLENQGYE